jgi:hypothetical protein
MKLSAAAAAEGWNDGENAPNAIGLIPGIIGIGKAYLSFFSRDLGFKYGSC